MNGPTAALVMSPAVTEAIRRHAQATYPDECCGALIGRNATVREAFPLPNTTAEGPRRRFLVRPDDYREAERRATGLGVDLLGFYHSHPDHPARPSQYDLDHAWPTFAYLIVAVHHGVPGEMKHWRLGPDRSGFEEQAIVSDC